MEIILGIVAATIIALYIVVTARVVQHANRLAAENRDLREAISKFDHDKDGKIGGSRPKLRDVNRV